MKSWVKLGFFAFGKGINLQKHKETSAIFSILKYFLIYFSNKNKYKSFCGDL